MHVLLMKAAPRGGKYRKRTPKAGGGFTYEYDKPTKPRGKKPPTKINQMKGGKKVGPWIERMKDGKERARGVYVDGKKHGKWKHPNGDVSTWNHGKWEQTVAAHDVDTAIGKVARQIGSSPHDTAGKAPKKNKIVGVGDHTHPVAPVQRPTKMRMAQELKEIRNDYQQGFAQDSDFYSSGQAKKMRERMEVLSRKIEPERWKDTETKDRDRKERLISRRAKHFEARLKELAKEHGKTDLAKWPPKAKKELEHIRTELNKLKKRKDAL